VGIRCADHAAVTSPTSGGRSVGIVRVLAKTTEFCLFCFVYLYDPVLRECGSIVG
jgi:hypothetical protein